MQKTCIFKSSSQRLNIYSSALSALNQDRHYTDLKATGFCYMYKDSGGQILEKFSHLCWHLVDQYSI